MLHRIFSRLPAVLTLASVMLFAIYAFGQSPAAQPNSTAQAVAAPVSTPSIPLTKFAPSEKKAGDQDKEVAATENKVNSDEKKDDIKDEIAAIKAENAEVREQLRRMAEGQKILIEQLGQLRRQLNRTGGSGVPTASLPPGASSAPDAAVGDTANATADDTQAGVDVADNPTKPTTGNTKNPDDDRYQDGIIIYKTSDEAKVPFMLRFNVNTQIRYLNTLSSVKTFTDHLGVEREVNRRNDITVNRSMFILGGYIWDPRLRYSMTVWTSAGAASIVVAGNIGWQFNKHFTLTGGYTGVPGTRSLVNTFPYFTSTDRSMADNFFRPGFTQGVWANGEITKGLHYYGFIGNGLNTINVSAAKIDNNLLLAGSVWWEPLGDYGVRGKSVNMYDDYFESKKVRIRLGTSFTRSREDRFSNLDQGSPDNTSLYNSDGVLTFATGAFAPGVTVSEATYKMSATDGGLKWNGLAINGQYYLRWLDDFLSDGPIPQSSTFDHGYELSASYFVIPKKLLVYGRSSQVFGEFGNSYEYAGGVKWHFLPTERLWLNAELMRVNKVPYSGAFTPYTAGTSGWAPMIQSVIAF